jgi:hypothetical protein
MPLKTKIGHYSLIKKGIKAEAHLTTSAIAGRQRFKRKGAKKSAKIAKALLYGTTYLPCMLNLSYD